MAFSLPIPPTGTPVFNVPKTGFSEPWQRYFNALGVALQALSGTLVEFDSIIVDNNVEADTYSVAGTPGANFSGVVTNLTVVDGLVTGAS